MTLYYNIVFGLLVFEMVLFSMLAIPFGSSIKRTSIEFFTTNPLMKQARSWFRFVFVGVLILLADSVNRVWRVNMELRSYSHNRAGAAILATDRSEIQARRFYSERNMYLCGFTVFLTFVLHSYVNVLSEAIVHKEAVDSQRSVDAIKDENVTLKKEIATLKANKEALLAQTKNLQRQYEEVAGGSSEPTDKKGQ